MGIPQAWLFGHCCKLPSICIISTASTPAFFLFFSPYRATYDTSSLLLHLHSLLLMTLVTLFVSRCIDFDRCFAYRCFVTPVLRWFSPDFVWSRADSNQQVFIGHVLGVM